MIELYVAKGVSEVDARIIINTLAKYPEVRGATLEAWLAVAASAFARVLAHRFTAVCLCFACAQAFLDHMMVEELGLLPPESDQGFSPAKAGMVTMGSFMAFGSVPLLPYLIALLPGLHLSASTQLWASVGATILTLFLLGAFKGKTVEIKKSAWWRSGLLMSFNGTMAAVVGQDIHQQER